MIKRHYYFGILVALVFLVNIACKKDVAPAMNSGQLIYTINGNNSPSYRFLSGGEALYPNMNNLSAVFFVNLPDYYDSTATVPSSTQKIVLIETVFDTTPYYGTPFIGDFTFANLSPTFNKKTNIALMGLIVYNVDNGKWSPSSTPYFSLVLNGGLPGGSSGQSTVSGFSFGKNSPTQLLDDSAFFSVRSVDNVNYQVNFYFQGMIGDSSITVSGSYNGTIPLRRVYS